MVYLIKTILENQSLSTLPLWLFTSGACTWGVSPNAPCCRRTFGIQNGDIGSLAWGAFLRGASVSLPAVLRNRMQHHAWCHYSNQKPQTILRTRVIWLVSVRECLLPVSEALPWRISPSRVPPPSWYFIKFHPGLDLISAQLPLCLQFVPQLQCLNEDISFSFVVYYLFVGFSGRGLHSVLYDRISTLLASNSLRNSSLLRFLLTVAAKFDWICPDVPEPRGVCKPIPLYISFNYCSLLLNTWSLHTKAFWRLSLFWALSW